MPSFCVLPTSFQACSKTSYAMASLLNISVGSFVMLYVLIICCAWLVLKSWVFTVCTVTPSCLSCSRTSVMLVHSLQLVSVR